MSYPITTKVRVRFADIDSMGHVNNAKFFTYMEQARVAYFQKIPELDFRLQNDRPKLSVILASIQCNFLSPAMLDEELQIGVRIIKLGRSSFEMEYEITEISQQRQIATGSSTQVHFNYETQQSVPIPDELKDKLISIEGREL